MSYSTLYYESSFVLNEFAPKKNKKIKKKKKINVFAQL